MQYIRGKVYSSLRSSEKFFKTDMIYLAKGGFWLTFAQIVSAISTFALSIAFAHLFPKDEYGVYRYVIALAGITFTFSLTGLGAAVTQSVARGFDGSLKLGFKEYLKWSAGIIVISISGIIYYYLNHNLDLVIAFIIIGTLSPLLNGFSLYNSYLTGKRNFESLGILSLIRNGLPAIGLIISIFITKSAIIIVAIYFIAHTIASGLCYLITLITNNPTGEKDPAMLGYAKHLSFMSILNMIADQIDKIIVFHYVGAVELAVYSFATALPTQIKSLLRSIYSLALPKFSNKPLIELQKNMSKQMLQLLVVTIISILLYILTAPFLFKLFFSNYMESVLYSQIFVFSLISVVGIIPTTILQSKKLINSMYKANILFACTKIILLFGGISLFGFWGVIFARVSYEYIGFGIAYWYALTSKEASGSTNVGFEN